MNRRVGVEIRRITAFLVGILAVTLATAQAQTAEWEGRAFVSLNGGGQVGDTVFEAPLTVEKFNELARFETEHTSGNGGLLDVSGGIRLINNLAFGVGFSLIENQNDVTGSGTVPNPLFFDRARSVTYEETGLKHRELGIHFSGVYVIPLSDRILVSIFGGPTIFRLRQDLVSDVALGPETDAPFFDIVRVVSVSTTTVSETGFGGHVGFDGTFLLNDQLGVGGFFRYAGGSVDLTTGGATVTVDLGGAQFGGGLRLFF